jgi:formylglycine-generating enzyme required for sulfatase activity
MRLPRSIARAALIMASVLSWSLCEARADPAEGVLPRRVVSSPASRFRECADCPAIVVLPAGAFLMGDVIADPGQELATTHRKVTIDKPFAIGIYDVSRSEFAAFVRATGWKTGHRCYYWRSDIIGWSKDGLRDWRNPGFPQTDRDPVVCVNLEDAEAYVRWLNAQIPGGSSNGEGPYRVPSEEEWEYAGRGGGATPYFWGSSVDRARANYGSDHCPPCGPAVGERDRWRHTSPVGSFPPNAFGLYDMAGDVSQWTESCLNDAKPPFETSAHCKRGFLTNNDDMAVIRGGSWQDAGEYLRVGRRIPLMQINRNNVTGFRVIRDLQ